MNPSNRRWKRALAPLVVGLLVGLGFVAVTRGRSMSVFVVPSSSMSPTIVPGDRVLVVGEVGRGPQRGEVWVFTMPPAAGAAAGNVAIKRVIGLPGETVDVRDGRVWINGEALDEGAPALAPNYEAGPFTLGPEEYFVLGDNRNNSADSHVWGPAPAGAFIGRVRGRYWPVSRFSGL